MIGGHAWFNWPVIWIIIPNGLMPPVGLTTAKFAAFTNQHTMVIFLGEITDSRQDGQMLL